MKLDIVALQPTRRDFRHESRLPSLHAPNVVFPTDW
jgi:hypothetical protein